MKSSGPRVSSVLILVLVLTWMAVGVAVAQPEAVEGEPFPSIVLPDVVAGEARDARELVADKVGAIIFMQTSCGVCKKELRVFEEFSQKYGDKLAVVAISVDSGGPGRVVGFRKGHGFPFTFLHDPQFETPGRFGLFFTPGLVLVGANGNIEMIKSGFQADDKGGLDVIISQLASKAIANR